MKRRAAAILALAAAVAAAALGVQVWRDRAVGPVQRGARIAQAQGCFTCHGPGGLRGAPDPGYGMDEVPAWTGGLVTMYANDEAELREWILDGIPRRVRADPEQMKLREHAVVLMPAWRGRLGQGEVDDLVAYVKAVSDMEKPPDGPARAGRDVADTYGCFGCHGPQGRGALPNPGSFKGYIPGWDGADFGELARDDAEIREWVLTGTVQRLQQQRVARFFMERAMVRMPAYQGHVTDAEVTKLLDYIHWLRQPAR
jgi:mono/diheme cytochrome c family protein